MISWTRLHGLNNWYVCLGEYFFSLADESISLHMLNITNVLNMANILSSWYTGSSTFIIKYIIWCSVYWAYERYGIVDMYLLSNLCNIVD